MRRPPSCPLCSWAQDHESPQVLPNAQSVIVVATQGGCSPPSPELSTQTLSRLAAISMTTGRKPLPSEPHTPTQTDGRKKLLILEPAQLSLHGGTQAWSWLTCLTNIIRHCLLVGGGGPLGVGTLFSLRDRVVERPFQ